MNNSNFPAPPSFHDPLLYPPSSSGPTTSRLPPALPPSARDQQQVQQTPTPASPQQQLQQQQLQLLMNGINMNGGNLPGAVSLPTPAGHQAELNYIYGMVEELSRQLAQNQRALEEVVAGVGRVRNRARSQSLGNQDLISSTADEVKAQDPNLDALISLLSEALEKAKYSRDANAALLSQYATVVSQMLKQFHDYKAKHVADVAAWHRSYRAQLAEARAENCRLREQIWEMHAHAGAANDLLRRFRTAYDEDEARWNRRVDDRARRQELRFWKRMAMPNLPDDDPYWSDDDDLIDVAEKDRLTNIAKRLAEQQAAAAAASAAGESVELDSEAALVNGPGGEQMSLSNENLPPQGQGTRTGTLPFPMSLMGGVPMQRGDNGSIMPIPPPRPLSAASSTGSTGQ
ncbi:hypothetical protein QBC34DRAFT_115602 [Podospora aff. communis PSN243]|uniref:Uncharacterized protein n=1 Tax=Podospora aff. communis PSN243 TaxID=3040156 RepID=A0AAV9GIS0_9PEZI|nr:hypothetical protein QBC34DRAFT_115602 [Podospora aff. communis PSN243]